MLKLNSLSHLITKYAFNYHTTVAVQVSVAVCSSCVTFSLTARASLLQTYNCKPTSLLTRLCLSTVSAVPLTDSLSVYQLTTYICSHKETVAEFFVNLKVTKDSCTACFKFYKTIKYVLERRLAHLFMLFMPLDGSTSR